MKRILVTGASGRVGRHIARRLVRENVDLRLGFSSAQGLKTHPGVCSMLGNYNDAGQMAEVFSSIDAMFLYAPEIHASKAVFNAAQQAGVRQVVLLSSASVIKAPPGTNPIAERHRAAENAAIEAGLDWTFIRPDTMASNCLQWAADIRAEGRVYTPYPESMRSAVHEDDIALLAASALIGTQFKGRAFYLTGDQLLTIRGQVQSIAEQLGQNVQCVQISPDEALQRMTANHIQSPQAAARILDYLKKSVTIAPGITDDFKLATGGAPKSFDQWVADNLNHFKRDPPSAPPAPPINHPHR